MSIPFSLNWIQSRCYNYILTTNFKKLNYKKIRSEIQKRVTFCYITIPLNNIIILKNYYIKNNIVICIKPLFGNKVIVFEKTENNISKIYTENKNFNIFSDLKKKRKRKCHKKKH